MPYSFSESSKYMFTSESVTEGHPDKLCDQISDAILDNILSNDPSGRVACEVSTTTGLVVVIGEITTSASLDYSSIVREAIKDAGYDDPKYGFDYQSCGVLISIHEQSNDIAEGVDVALEVREENSSTENEIEMIGAGDQGMMVGFACNETQELMPMPMSLSHKLTRRMSELRKSNELPYLRPDGKSQVTVEYAHGNPRRIDTVVLSTQHDPDVPQSTIERDLIEKVAFEVIPETLRDDKTIYHINPSGRFVIGGPVGDACLLYTSDAADE